jgi:hypothetical protein
MPMDITKDETIKDIIDHVDILLQVILNHNFSEVVV